MKWKLRHRGKSLFFETRKELKLYAQAHRLYSYKVTSVKEANDHPRR